MVDLQGREETLLFVKSGPDLETLLHELPDSLEFRPCGWPGTITAGRVRLRGTGEPTDGWLAQSNDALKWGLLRAR